MFDLIAAQEDQAVTRAQRLHLDDAEAAAPLQLHAGAETAQHPGEQSDQPQDQDQRQGKSQIRVKIHVPECALELLVALKGQSAGESCFVCHKGTPSHNLAPPMPAFPPHNAAMDCRSCHGVTAPLPHVDNGDSCTFCHH